MSTANRSLVQQQPSAPKRKRWTRVQVQKRRIEVWESHCCGQPVFEMAAGQGVSERTIERDLAWWREKLGFSTEQLKNPEFAAIDVGMTAAKLNQIADDAYVEYMAAQNGAVKVRFLEARTRALALRHKLLADAGYLPKVPHEQEFREVIKVTFESRFGSDSPQAVFDKALSRRRILEASETVLRLSAEEGFAVDDILEASLLKDDPELGPEIPETVDEEVPIPEEDFSE